MTRSVSSEEKMAVSMNVIGIPTSTPIMDCCSCGTINSSSHIKTCSIFIAAHLLECMMLSQ